MKKIDPKRINTIVTLGINNIKDTFRNIDNRNGWHQHLGSNKVGNTATAIGILLLNSANDDSNKKNLAISTLIESQQNSNNPTIDGGWSYVSNLNNLPATDPTCWALKALISEYPIDHESIKKGVNWLLANHCININDTGWGVIKSDVPRVWSTCFALQVLKALKYEHTPQFQSGLHWLINAQNADYGWGERFGYASTVSHTANVIITLLICGYDSNSEYINTALGWLINSYQNKPYWENFESGGFMEYCDVELIQNGQVNFQRISYHHNPECYAAISLIKAGRTSSPIVFDCVMHLMISHKNSYWTHPFLQSLRINTIWSIYDALTVFDQLKKAINAWDHLKEIKLKDSKVIWEYSHTSKWYNQYSFLQSKIIWGILGMIVLSAGVYYFNIALTPIQFITVILIPLLISILANIFTK